jgi:hypothetical protein
MMSKGRWEFSADPPREPFAASFRSVIGGRKPALSERMAGPRLEFSAAAATSAGDPFEGLDRLRGVKCNVVAVATNAAGVSPTGERLTLVARPDGGTAGTVQFRHALGATGKDLGDLALTSTPRSILGSGSRNMPSRTPDPAPKRGTRP